MLQVFHVDSSARLRLNSRARRKGRGVLGEDSVCMKVCNQDSVAHTRVLISCGVSLLSAKESSSFPEMRGDKMLSTGEVPACRCTSGKRVPNVTRARQLQLDAQPAIPSVKVEKRLGLVFTDCVSRAGREKTNP